VKKACSVELIGVYAGTMKLEIHFHQMDSTDALKTHIEGAADKLSRYVEDGELVKVVLGTNGHHQLSCEIFWHDKDQHKDVFAKEQGSEMYSLIDTVVDKAHAQLKKLHDKKLDRQHKKEPLKKAST